MLLSPGARPGYATDAAVPPADHSGEGVEAQSPGLNIRATDNVYLIVFHLHHARLHALPRVKAEQRAVEAGLAWLLDAFKPLFPGAVGCRRRARRRNRHGFGRGRGKIGTRASNPGSHGSTGVKALDACPGPLQALYFMKNLAPRVIEKIALKKELTCYCPRNACA